MKNFFLCILIGLTSSQAWCMELSLKETAKEAIEGTTTLTDFFTKFPELKELILSSIFNVLWDFEQACKDIKAFAITSKRSSLFLKEDRESATVFLTYLYGLSYRNSFNFEKVCLSISSLLHKYGNESFMNNNLLCSELVGLFEESGKNKNWDSALERLQGLKNRSLTNCILNYYWRDKYEDDFFLKTLFYTRSRLQCL